MKNNITYLPYKSTDDFNFTNIEQGKYIFSVEQDKLLISSGIVTASTILNKNRCFKSLIIYFDNSTAQITYIVLIKGRFNVLTLNNFLKKIKLDLSKPVIDNKLAPSWLESNEVTLIHIPKWIKSRLVTWNFNNDDDIQWKSYLYTDESTPQVIKDLHKFFILKLKNESKVDLISWVDEFNDQVLNKLKDLDTLKDSQISKVIKVNYIQTFIEMLNPKSLLSLIKRNIVLSPIMWNKLLSLIKQNMILISIEWNTLLSLIKRKITLLPSKCNELFTLIKRNSLLAIIKRYISLTIIKYNNLLTAIQGKSRWENREFFTQTLYVKRTLWSNYLISVYLWLLKFWIGLCVILSFIMWLPIEYLPIPQTKGIITPIWIDLKNPDDMIIKPIIDSSSSFKDDEKIALAPTSWLSILGTFALFSLTYFIIGDPFSLNPISTLIKSTASLMKKITYPLHSESIAENFEIQSMRINELTQEVARLTNDRNDIIRSSSRRVSEFSQRSSFSINESNSIIDNQSIVVNTLRNEVNRLTSEREAILTNQDFRIKELTEEASVLAKERAETITNQSVWINKLTEESDELLRERNATINNLTTQINELTQEISRLTAEHNVTASNQATQINELIDKISNLTAERNATISEKEIEINTLREEITRISTEHDITITNQVREINKLTEEISRLGSDKDSTIFEQSSQINKATQEIIQLTAERDATINNEGWRINKLTEEVNRLANERDITTTNQSSQINELTQKVAQLTDERDVAITKGLARINELTDEINQIIIERNDIVIHGKEVEDKFNTALATIDNIKIYLESIGHSFNDGTCPTAEWYLKNAHTIDQLHREILRSGGAATKLNLSLANDLSVSISELMAIFPQ